MRIIEYWELLFISCIKIIFFEVMYIQNISELHSIYFKDVRIVGSMENLKDFYSKSKFMSWLLPSSVITYSVYSYLASLCNKPIPKGTAPFSRRSTYNFIQEPKNFRKFVFWSIRQNLWIKLLKQVIFYVVIVEDGPRENFFRRFVS